MPQKRIQLLEHSPAQQAVSGIVETLPTHADGLRVILESDQKIYTSHQGSWIVDTPQEGWRTHLIYPGFEVIFKGGEWVEDITVLESVELPSEEIPSTEIPGALFDPTLYPELIGPQGAQGDTGSQGYQGENGTQGYQGDTGSQGYQGAKGEQGDQGTQGTQGNQGYQGDEGNDGTSVSILGSFAVVGDLPSTGNTIGDGYLVNGYLYVWNGTSWENVGLIQGPRGYQGVKGEQGDQGPRGYQGVKGDRGYQGAQGYQGERGYTGYAGSQGPQGSAGAQGPRGYQGYQGDDGRTGSSGAPGDQGPQGYQGYQGADGSQASGSGKFYSYHTFALSGYTIEGDYPGFTVDRILKGMDYDYNVKIKRIVARTLTGAVNFELYRKLHNATTGSKLLPSTGTYQAASNNRIYDSIDLTVSHNYYIYLKVTSLVQNPLDLSITITLEHSVNTGIIGGDT